MVKRPEIGLLGILVATSSIVFEDTLPLLPLGPVGSLHISDLVLLFLLGLIVFRWLTEPDFDLIHTPLDLPLFSFYIIALLSTSKAIFQSSLELHMARRAVRVMTYYLTFFVVTNLVRKKRQVFLLTRGIFVLAIISALVMIAQFAMGESVRILPGRVETLQTQGIRYIGITRILPPGLPLILVAFITITSILILEEFKPENSLYTLQAFLLGLALLMTFLRSYWVVVCFVLLILVFFLEGRFTRIIWAGAVFALLIAIVFFVVIYQPDTRMSKLIFASLDRVSTLGRDGVLNERSLQFRFIENEYAVSQVIANPLLGLGLGARYRPWDPRLDWKSLDGGVFDGRAFLHNGHLWIMMKTGLLGYLSFAFLSGAYLFRGLRYWRRISSSLMQGIVLGLTLAYLGILIGAIVNSTFLEWNWSPLLGIMMALNEVIYRLMLQQTS
jgi:O-antigen ligase